MKRSNGSIASDLQVGSGRMQGVEVKSKVAGLCVRDGGSGRCICAAGGSGRCSKGLRWGKGIHLELPDLLFLATIENLEVFLVKTGDRLTFRVADDDRHKNQIARDSQSECRRVCVLGGRS
jgi:hypothetical protein